MMSQDQEGARRVGESLRQAREQNGMSISEAAERLHILSSYISAMESGRYGVLPGTVFLRGYVRSYARLLALNEEAIVAQLDRELGATKEENARLVEAKAIPPKKSTSPRRWLVALAVFLLLVGGFLQYQHLQTEQGNAELSQEAPQVESGDPVTGEADPTPDVTQPSEQVLPADEAEADMFSEDESSGANGEAVPNEPVPDGTVSEESTGSVVIGGAVVDGAVVDGAAMDNTSANTGAGNRLSSAPEDSGATGAGSEVNASSPVTAAADVVGGAGDQLQVSFTGESWFEVEDARGKRRRGLFDAGDTLVFQGRAPLRVVVGAASETQMVFNGVEVDYSRYSVWNNRVGLTLGQ